MIEVLVSSPIVERGLRRRGDILVAKLAGSPWGYLERSAVVRWDDPALEAELVAKQNKGEPHPLIAYPYAESESVVRGGRTFRVMVSRSQISVDLEALDPADRARIESRDPSDLPPLDVPLRTLTREAETRGGEPLPSRSPPLRVR